MFDIVDSCLANENGNRKYWHIAISHWKLLPKIFFWFYRQVLLKFILKNARFPQWKYVFLVFDDQVFQQFVWNPKGTNFASLVTDLLLYSYYLIQSFRMIDDSATFYPFLRFTLALLLWQASFFAQLLNIGIMRLITIGYIHCSY